MRKYEANRGRVVLSADRTSLEASLVRALDSFDNNPRLNLQEGVLFIGCGHHIEQDEVLLPDVLLKLKKEELQIYLCVAEEFGSLLLLHDNEAPMPNIFRAST